MIAIKQMLTAAWQMPGDSSQTRSDGTVEGIPKGSLVPGWRPARERPLPMSQI